MNKLKEYLASVNNRFDKHKSVTDILKDFKVQTTDEIINKSNNVFSYSNYDFLKCDIDEKKDFYNNQLQFIECLVTNAIYDKVGNAQDWGYIIKLLIDKNYAQTLKTNRKVVFPTSFQKRPIGDSGFEMWNGLQIIDLDIKNTELAENLKNELFENLKQYNWFLGVCKSASQKGLHVWTKINPITFKYDQRRLEYICNFRHKYSYVFLVLRMCMQKYGYTEKDMINYLDMAMAKPQQGIFISSDEHPYVNMNFKDERIDVRFEDSFNNGVESINWISEPKLMEIFSKLEWFAKDEVPENIVKVENVKLNEQDRDVSKNKRQHYKHAQRWQLANTLASLFGKDKGLKYLIEICSGTPKSELAGDINTAANHDKPVSIWAIKELNKNHGFKIKIDSDEHFNKEIENIKQEDETGKDITRILNDQSNKVKLYINHNQYLSDIKDDIIKNLGHITLLEAGAGYGKTEMIKSLKAKTLLILPFTSTIKSKIEADASTNEWLYFYGSKRPKLEDLMANQNVTMTIDKFSNLNVIELDNAGYEYIVIDESHLLFTSSYRSVMGPCIQRLANCKAKIILMTGTPTGELLFFPDIKHIKVYKEDTRIKHFNICKTQCRKTMPITIADSMADDIIKGRKILFPTNNGQLYYNQIMGLVTNRLLKKGYTEPIKNFYYKKSNYGTQDMDDINFKKTVGENDIICCTTYLSVGVDICDKKDFCVYFDEMWIPQDIEQFANRLRNNDLYIKLFIPLADNDGIPISYDREDPLYIGFKEEDIILARDFVKMCNDMMIRNEQEYKYNPIIQSMLSTNHYLKYDENVCRYYIDETTYKLSTFEERYKQYATQLKVLCKGMIDFGYEIIEQKEDAKSFTEKELDDADKYLKDCKKQRYDYITQQTIDYLNHITEDNIDVYKEMISGNYDIFKSDKYENDRQANNIYVEDIEIVEKNTPIVINLYKYFDIETIKKIFISCIDNNANKLNYSKLKRISRLVTIELNRKAKKIDFPVLKYIYDAKKWAEKNPKVKKEDILKFIGDYTIKYANSIPELIIQDSQLLEHLYNIEKELFGVVIEQSKPKNKIVNIKPFDLPWERKKSNIEIIGNLATDIFFLGDLIEKTNNDKEEENKKLEEYESSIPELNHVESLVSIESIRNNINDIIHSDFNYYIYSKEDNSNERFMTKQGKQFTTKHPTSEIDEDANGKISTQLDLFDNECPF